MDFIEIFHSSDPQTPYYAIVWRSRTVVEITRCTNLTEIAHFCAQRTLPVVSKKEALCEQLRLHNVETQPFTTHLAYLAHDHDETYPLAGKVIGSNAELFYWHQEVA